MDHGFVIVDYVESTKETKGTKIKRLEEEVQLLTKAGKDEKKLNSKLCAEISDLKGERESLRKEIEDWKKQLAECEDKLAQSKKQVDSWGFKRNRIQHDLDAELRLLGPD